jgi:hypothetical protein
MKTEVLTKSMRPMSDEAKINLLKGYSARVGHSLLGNASELAERFAEAAKPENYKVAKDTFAEVVRRCVEGDKAERAEAQQELQGIVIWSVENYLFAASNYVSFFETGTLGETDTAFIEFTDHHHFEAHVNLIGPDGGAPRWQRVRTRDRQIIPFYQLTTDELEYPIMDLYSGKIADRSKIGLDLAGDMAWKIDARLFDNIADLIGPFTLTGNKLNRVYVSHSRIKTANLPTTNLLVAAGNTATSLFRKACLDAIIAYAKAWGDKSFADGPLVPQVVFVPSAHITGFLTDCSINDADNKLNAQVFEFGIIMNYGGFKWMFVADPTLDPADGLAYVKFNKGIGKHWTKPSADKNIIDDSPALQKENRETQLIIKTFATALPSYLRTNVAAVKYRD